MLDDRNDIRRSPRLSPKLATRAEAFRDPAGTGRNLAVRLLDLSEVGAKLALAEPLPPGHLLGVAFYGPHLLPIAGTARVVWTKEAPDGTFVTGVEFALAAGTDNVGALAR